MDDRAARLIRDLNLQPHPEGGHFKEIFRSFRSVQPLDPRPARSALTTIFFLLEQGQTSRWHRVASDEVWHFFEGDPLELFWIADEYEVQRRILGEIDNVAMPVHVVPAGRWQAARTTGAYTLAGCTVAPGFEFADFDLMDESGPEWDMLSRAQDLPEELRRAGS